MSPHTTHVNIVGVNINCDNRQTILDKVETWAKEEQQHTISYVNAHCLNLSYQDHEYRDVLNQSDLIYPDGISIVWASKFLGGCHLEKVTGREWILDICKLAVSNNLRLYILAGLPGIARKAKDNLLNNFPGLQITGATDGYFQEKNNEQVLNEINSTKPHLLFVGMGSPLQEFWIFKYCNYIDAPICWSVGALFDYVAGIEPSVPAWLNAIGLEWMWRMLFDPSGKWKRYLLGNPLFVIRVILQKFSK